MAGGNVYGGSNMNVLLQNQSLSGSSQALESLWCPNSSTKLHGSKHLVNVGDNKRGRNADRQLLTSLSKDDYNDEDFNDCFQQPGKKRRLTVDQVQFLERNFEIENKLDPERKVRLAKEVRLQPRQVAIWFQNRRARFKTKQLEKEYDCLKASYDKLKTDFDNLLKDNEKLKDEVHSLKDKLTRDSGKENQENVDHNATNSSNSESPRPNGVFENSANFTVIACKQEDASSAKSDIFDPDSPHYMDGINSSFLEPAYSSDVFESDNNCSFLEPAYSSNIFEPDQSDFSQDDDDNFSKSLLQTHYFPKLEEGVDDLSFPIEEQLFCFWP